MTAPYPTVANFTEPYQILQYFNMVTDDWFGRGILLVIFIIAFASSKNLDAKRAFAVSSFITAIFGILLRTMGLIGDVDVMVVIIMASIGFVSLMSESQGIG